MSIIVDNGRTVILSDIGNPVIVDIGSPGTNTEGGGGGVTDHGALTGLTDDDHSQYALADGTRGSFATTAQGALADSATQSADLATAVSDHAAAADPHGDRAYADGLASDYATAAQGTTADSAVQPGDLGAVATSNDYDDLANLPTLGTAAATAATDYATAAQGATADSAIQPGDSASTTVAGVVELATASEVDSSDAARAMTGQSYQTSTPRTADRTADWTLAQSDANVEQQFNSASARVCTIDTNANVAISVGTVIPFLRVGAGDSTIDANAGVTLNGTDGGSLVISTQYQGALLRKTATDTWVLSGDVA